MASIPELLHDHVTLEVECLDRLYLNGYIGKLATSGGLVPFMREQLGKPIPSPVVLGQVTERFLEEVRTKAEREFFEEIIRDNLDLGRPDRVQLIFNRVVTKKTSGEFRTRVIQQGVHPSLHVEYKNFNLKQYFK